MMTLFEVVLSALQQWRQDTFGTTDPNDPSGGDLADPDGDGMSNLEEYSNGSNPKVADISRRSQLGQVTVGAAIYPTISYRMLTSTSAAISYSVEETTALGGWSPIDMTSNLVAPPVDQGDGTVLVTLRGNTRIGAGKSFLRLRVTASP